MDIIYLLLFIALIIVIIIVVVFYWAVKSNQFDDLEGPAHRILMDEEKNIDLSAKAIPAKEKRPEDSPSKELKSKSKND